MFEETDSKEDLALRIIGFRKPIALLAAGLTVYVLFGVPALRMKEYGAYSKCVTLTGEKIDVYGQVPLIFLTKKGQITFPRQNASSGTR